jgi:hypothetical protein
MRFPVIPAKAGIQFFRQLKIIGHTGPYPAVHVALPKREVRGRCSKTSKKDLLASEILKIRSTLPGFEGPGNFWKFHYVRRMRNSPDRFGTNKR